MPVTDLVAQITGHVAETLSKDKPAM